TGAPGPYLQSACPDRRADRQLARGLGSMTGRAQRDAHNPHPTAPADPDQLEVVEGTAHENVEGWVPELASEADLRQALEKAFDYRGDITLTLKDGSKLEGYCFDRRTGASLADSFVRLIPKDSPRKVAIAYSQI